MAQMEMVQKRLGMLEDLEEELRRLRRDAKEVLENEPGYEKVKEETDLVRERIKEKKAQIAESSVYNELRAKIKEVQEEIKDLKDALSQELIELYKEEGLTMLESPSGRVKKLKFDVKLIDA